MNDRFLEGCRCRRCREWKQARRIIRIIMRAPPITMPTIPPIGNAECFSCVDGIKSKDVWAGAKVLSVGVVSVKLERMEEVETTIVVWLVWVFRVLESVVLDCEALVFETIEDF